MAGTNLKLGHCRQDNCTSEGGYDHEERLLYVGAGDVAESIGKAEWGPVLVDSFCCSSSISASYWKRGRAG